MIRISRKFLQKYINDHPECFSEMEKYPGWSIFDIAKNQIYPINLRYCLTCR